MPKSTRTLAQIQASRENGKKSDGPKNTSKTRLNAIKHGILTDIVHCETEEERQAFEAMRDALMEDLAPETQMEQFYAERIAQCIWRTRLIEKRLANPHLGSEVWERFGRYDRMVSRELTIAEDKLAALQTARIGRDAISSRPLSVGQAASLSDSDGTNPSDAATPTDSGDVVDLLRRVTRAVELLSERTEQDDAFLRMAAQACMRQLMPDLELPCGPDNPVWQSIAKSA